MRISDWSSDVCSSDLWFLANILIAREARVYGEQKTTAGGWNGWRDFRVEAITRERSVIKSFILRPADGSAVMPYKPGPYLTVWFDIPGHPPVNRTYSLMTGESRVGKRSARCGRSR